MTINDLVLPIETCKLLKEAGFEFPESVFVWAEYKDKLYIAEREYLELSLYNHAIDTLTLQEVYCWVLELVFDNKLDLADYPCLHYVCERNEYFPARISFSTGGCPVYAGTSEELNPLKAADRYINNLLNTGVLKK